MKIAKALLILPAATLVVTGLLAEEGMWMPQQIPEMAVKLRALGFQGD